jgi:hypothetical protein
MKKILILITLFITAVLPTIAQTINNPLVRNKDDGNTIIKRIETNNNYTILTFQTTAATDNSWVQLNKEIYLQTNLSNAHYNYVKSENIAMVPQKQILNNAGDKLIFRVYFKKIPAATKYINIIERGGSNSGDVSYFNFYNVSLTQSSSASALNQYTFSTKSIPTVVDSVRVITRPPVPSEIRMDSPADNNEMADAMNAMGPMMNTMSKAMMDAQLNYFKQPGKIAELAKLNKEYYDALKKAGFSNEDALKLVASSNLLFKPMDMNKK